MRRLLPVAGFTVAALVMPGPAAASGGLGSPFERGLHVTTSTPVRAGAPVPPRPTSPAIASLRPVAVQQVARQAVTPQPGSEPDTVVEPDLAVDPTDSRVVVAVAQQGRFPNGESVDPGYAWSHDGGATWRHANLPKLTKAVGGVFDRASDPAVAFGPDGSVYASTIAGNVGDCSSVVAVQRSTDHGVTFGAPVLEQNSNDCSVFEDKNWITVDTNRGSPHFGRIYGPWTRFVTRHGHQISAHQILKWSDDHGRTWHGPVLITPFGGNTEGAQPVVQPDGSVVNVHVTFATVASVVPNAVVAEVSRDGGHSWSRSRLAGRVFGPDVVGVRSGDLVSATVDPRTGMVYAAWADQRFRRRGSDVVVASSADGRSWSPPVRVNQDPLSDRVWHFTPDVAAYAGAVYTSYRTRSGDSSRVGFAISASRDGGRRFGMGADFGPVTNLRFAAVAPVPFLGDYMGLAATAGRLYAVWCVSSRPPHGGRYHQTLWAGAFTTR